jgi:hypothetical protein
MGPPLMSLLTKLERALGRFAIPDLPLYLIAGQVLFWGLWLMTGFNLEHIALLPMAVRAGEAWRLVSFLFFPASLNTSAVGIVFLAFTWYMFYLMGGALEDFWGAYRFNAFVGLGWLLTVAVAFLTPGVYATNVYLLASVFLAFAFLNPDFTLLIFFILPVKIKWLALILWLGYAYMVVMGSWSDRLLVVASTGNFFVFFAHDLVARIRTGRRQMAYQARAAAARSDEREARHRCRVCGRTDLTDSKLDFRYCSKCAGNQCYCSDHIFNHAHVAEEEDAKR